MNYKALAIDLDGTLLVGEEVPIANIAAIRAARDAGYKIIIATARWKEMALRVANTLQIEGPIIACSGAQVYDPATRVDVFDERLPEEFTRELYTICNQERCIATVTISDRVLLKLDGEPDTAAMNAEMNWVRELEHDPFDLPRIGAIQGTSANARIKNELQQAYSETVNIFDSIGPTGKIIITITSKGATKGAALRAACNHMGLDAKEVIAFGDAENDLTMFAVAGASVAMGQADERVKQAADFISTPNSEAGVGHAIRHLLKNGSF